MTLETNEPNDLPIYKLQLNPQYPVIQDLKNLFNSTTLYILTKKDSLTEKSTYILQNGNVLKNEILSPLPSIITFNFYNQKDNPLFLITVVKDIIFIIDYNQINQPKVKEFLIDIFNSLNKTTFIPFSEKDHNLFHKNIIIDNLLLPQNLTELYEENGTLINSFEKFIQQTFRKFNLKEEIKDDNYYIQDNIFLICYKARLLYCVNRYYYTNEYPSLDFYNQKFSFNENFKENDFFEVMNLDSVSSFNINRNNFAPCSFQYLVNDNICYTNFENIVEFHKNAHFSPIIPCYGCIRFIDNKNRILVYKYMKNKNIKHKFNKQNDYFTPEIVSATIYRISSVIFFLHSNNLIHRKITISNSYFDSYNRVYLGGFKLILNEDGNNEYSREEFSKEDHQNTKEYDIQSFGELIIKLYENAPNCLDQKIKKLAKNCMDKKVNASDVLKEILKNNFFYLGKKRDVLNFLISDQFDLSNNFTLNIKNTLKSLHVSNIFTLVNQKNSSGFEFNDLMDIQIFILKNRIFENVIIDMFIQNSWKFAVFGFFNYKNNYSSTKYLCICVENNYFLINSYFLTGMKKLLFELTKLILIPVSIEAKNEFEKIVKTIENEINRQNNENNKEQNEENQNINNQQNEENQPTFVKINNESIISKFKFTFLNDKEIQEIQNSINLIDKICKLSMTIKQEIILSFQFLDNPLNQFIQPLTNAKKYIQFTNFKLPLIGYFMQRIYFESDSFQNSIFFDRCSKFRTYIESNQAKNHLSLNDFQILRLIGSGGSSQVYLAIHNVTLTFVALKMYDSNNENFLREKEFFEKYGKEKYIIECYGTFYDKENRGVLIMDFKSNGCISEFSHKPKYLKEKDLNMKIILNLLFALHNLHCNIKYIYQDLTRHNIMVNHNFDIFLSDFETSIPFDKDENSFQKDLFQFGKIVYYLCEKKEMENNNFQLTDKSLKVLNLILHQCNNSSYAKYGSTLLFIYEIKFFGGLYPDNNREIFEKIFHENESLLNESSIVSTFQKNISFQNYASPENRNMFSYFSNFDNIKFVSLLLEICYDNGYIVKKNRQKALNYFMINQFGQQADIDKIVTTSKYSSSLDFKLGLIYLKGISGKLKDFTKSKEYFEKAKKLSSLSLLCDYEILKLDLKRNNPIDYQYYIKLINDTKSKDNKIKSKILFRVALYLYKNQKTDASEYFLKAISLNPDNHKAIKLFGTLYFDKSKSILPENSNYFNDKFLLSGKTHESLGDIYFANNNIHNSIRYYSCASKLGELTASFKLGLIYSSTEHKDIIKDDLKSIFYFSRVINYHIDQDLKESEKKKIYEYKLFSNILILKLKIKHGCISVDQLKRYPFLDIDYANKTIEDKNDQYYFNFGQKHFQSEIPDDVIISLLCFEISSRMDNCEAQFSLGQIYYESKYVTQNVIKAVQYFTKAADFHSHQKSQAILGAIYYEGEEGIERDLHKSIEYYTLATENHDHIDPETLFNLGSIYYEEEEVFDIEKTIHYFDLAASENHPEAQFNLGLIYNDPKYGKNDVDKAIKYFMMASKQHLTMADYNLGMIFYEQKKIDDAINYFDHAVKQDYPPAQCKLGMIYLEGKYINKDINKSIYYFKLAANQNFVDAKFYLGCVYYYIYSFDSNQINLNNSINFLKEASSCNDYFSKINLAAIYLRNNNVNDAKGLLEEAVFLKNDKVALFNLATVYFFIENKVDESLPLLMKSAICGFSSSENLLGILIAYKFGRNNLQDDIHDIFLKNGIDNFELEQKILNIIKNNNLEDYYSYQQFYLLNSNKYYIYNFYHKPQEIPRVKQNKI